MGFDWPGPRRGAGVQTSASVKDATPPGNVRRSLLRQGVVRWSSSSTGARHEGDLGAGLSGFESIQGRARGSWGLQRSAAKLRFITRKRDRKEYVGDGRRSGLVKIVVFDETASGGGPGTISTRGSHPEQRWRDRERQRQDQDPRLRPNKPERPGSVARRDRGHGLIRIERCWTPREGTRGSSVIGAEAGGSPSSEAPLDHVHRKVAAGFGRF
jgi:hypothetical protein